MILRNLKSLNYNENPVRSSKRHIELFCGFNVKLSKFDRSITRKVVCIFLPLEPSLRSFYLSSPYLSQAFPSIPSPSHPSAPLTKQPTNKETLNQSMCRYQQHQVHQNENISLPYRIIDLIILLEITTSSRDDVDMNMRNCLPSLRTILSTENLTSLMTFNNQASNMVPRSTKSPKICITLKTTESSYFQISASKSSYKTSKKLYFF